MGRSRISDEQLLAAASQARNMADLLHRVGLVGCGGNYESMRDRLSALGALDQRFASRPARDGRSFPPDELLLSVWGTGPRSVAEIIRAVRATGYHATYRSIRTAAQRLGLDLSSLPGQTWRRGDTTPVVPPTPLAELLVAGRRTQGSRLRERLIEAGLKQARCEGCHEDTWLGQPMPLELDHISGDRTDNRLENLRLLCPNCHALTATYRGRNIGRAASA